MKSFRRTARPEAALLSPPVGALPSRSNKRPPESGTPNHETGDKPFTPGSALNTGPVEALLEAADEPQPPPRYYWARPLMQGYKGRIIHYVRDEVVEQVGWTLRELGTDSLINRFTEGPFGHLLDLRIGSSANKALHDLMAHELEDPTFSETERWFHIGGTEISFTAKDYTLVTGLVFTQKNFDPFAKEHIIPRNSFYRRIFQGKKVKIEYLRDLFNNHKLGDLLDDYLKAANILFLYHLLICCGNVWIANWVWALVEDMDGWAAFPWGDFSYQILCHNISTLYKHPNFFRSDTYHFFGPIWALQIWSYEAIKGLGDACGARDAELRIPRCLMWQTHKCTLELSSLADDEVLPLQVTCEEETSHYYIKFLEWQQGNNEVLFIPSKRNAWKKLPYARQKAMLASRKKTKKIVPHCALSKRRRTVNGRPDVDERPTSADDLEGPPVNAHDRSDGTQFPEKCCLHGVPCRTSDLDDEAHFARLAKRIAPHLPVDVSETGWIAILGKKLLQMTSDKPRANGAASSSRSIPATTPSHDGLGYEVNQATKEVIQDSHGMVPPNICDKCDRVSDKPITKDVFQMLCDYAPMPSIDVDMGVTEAGQGCYRPKSDPIESGGGFNSRDEPPSPILPQDQVPLEQHESPEPSFRTQYGNISHDWTDCLAPDFCSIKEHKMKCNPPATDVTDPVIET